MKNDDNAEHNCPRTGAGSASISLLSSGHAQPAEHWGIAGPRSIIANAFDFFYNKRRAYLRQRKSGSGGPRRLPIPGPQNNKFPAGANYGAGYIDYQKPYQAAGLDKSIQWYQAIGNHDQFRMGTTLTNNYTRKTLVGPNILNLGQVVLQPPYYVLPDWNQIMNTRGYYMGVVDGTTKYGDIMYAGTTARPIVADKNRRSLSISAWMNEFFNTTSQPVGHGFTRQMAAQGFACYHFYPKADMPIKVIVLDDTDKTGGAFGALDTKRYNWLVKELATGQANDELMIICAHIPIHPYAQKPPIVDDTVTPPVIEPFDYLTIWNENSSISENITEQQLLDTLLSYPNLIMWIAGHVHRNTITPQPMPATPPPASACGKSRPHR
jgi:hypothetical protein